MRVSMTALPPSASPARSRTAREPVGARALGQARAGNLLVARGHHLVAPGRFTQIWKPWTRPPFSRMRGGGHLRVHDAGAGGHPLHVAGADVPAVAGGVLVLPVALEQVGDGLEPAVRMVGRAHRLARAVLDRAHLVEEQEGVDLLQSRRGERTADDEAAAFLLGVG